MSLHIIIIDAITVLGWLLSAAVSLSAAAVCLFALQDGMQRASGEGREHIAALELAFCVPLILSLFILAGCAWWVCLSHVVSAIS